MAADRKAYAIGKSIAKKLEVRRRAAVDRYVEKRALKNKAANRQLELKSAAEARQCAQDLGQAQNAKRPRRLRGRASS